MSRITEVTGKVIVVEDQISGDKGGKTWYKQIFVIETSETKPAKLAFMAWGDKCDLIPAVGTEVTVKYSPESREYGGKWYTDLGVWNITNK